MTRQRPSRRLAARSRGCRRPRRGGSRRGLRLGGGQFVQLELQLLDLPIQLLRPAPELHSSQLGNQQLQAFDLGLTPRQLFVLGVQALALSPNLFRLHGERLMLGVDESL